MWIDTVFAIKLAVTRIVKNLNLPFWGLWRQEEWHGRTSAAVTSRCLLLTAALSETHRTSKGHATVQLPAAGRMWILRESVQACLCCMCGKRKKKNEDRTDGRGAFMRERYVVWVSRPPLALRLYYPLSFFTFSVPLPLSLPHSDLLLCDLCLTSVITVPTAAAVRFREGGVQTCPITWEQQPASSAGKYSCNFPFSLISLTLALGTYLYDNKTSQRQTSVNCFPLDDTLR